MASRKTSFFILVFLCCLIEGCYSTPVRHLSSDIALLQVGKSTKQDVIIYLGEPDDQIEEADGIQKFLYREKNNSFFRNTPLIGKKLGTSEVDQVVVTMKNGVVTACEYSYITDGDKGWSKNFSWQEKKQ
jgi:hypothetical protein